MPEILLSMDPQLFVDQELMSMDPILDPDLFTMLKRRLAAAKISDRSINAPQFKFRERHLPVPRVLCP